RYLTFHEHGVIGSFPSNRVRHLAADAGLFRQHYSTAIRSQPSHRSFHQLSMSHNFGFPRSALAFRQSGNKHICIRRIESAEVTGSFPHSASRRYRSKAHLVSQDAIVLGSTVSRRCVELLVAFMTTARRSTVSSKYLSAATACAVELSGMNPSAAIIRASF